MRGINADTFYMFVSFAAAILVLVVRPARVTGSHLSEDAPTQFVPMSDSLQASLVAAALDPRVDVETDVSHDPVVDPRSEEHTSELQSLMRISYAVFCLKKKTR